MDLYRELLGGQSPKMNRDLTFCFPLPFSLLPREYYMTFIHTECVAITDVEITEEQSTITNVGYHK